MPAIARLVQAHEDTVRDVIHAFNERGLAALDPWWTGGCPRLISDDDVEFVIAKPPSQPHPLHLNPVGGSVPSTRTDGEGSPDFPRRSLL